MAQVVVSVVIPTRNRLPYLKEAVASVQNQTFGEWELWIIDDASEDETPGWLRSIAQPRVRVVQLDRHGHRAAARNTGLAQAVGEYVIFLDDDDRFRPRALEVLVNALKSQPDAVAACGGTITFDESGNRHSYPHVRRPQMRVLWPQLIAGWIAGTGQVMFRTQMLRSIGGWNESLTALQDWDLMLRVSRLGRVYLHPYTVREYRRHPGQWYPYDHLEARNRVLQSFIDSLPNHERKIGKDAIRTRDLFELAREKLHTSEEPGQALRLFVAGYRASPGVVRSPMFRLGFIRGISQAFLARVGGRHAGRLLESSRRAVLRILRRSPGSAFQRKIVQGSTIRDDQTGK